MWWAHSHLRGHAINFEDLGLEGQEATVDSIRSHTQKQQDSDMNINLPNNIVCRASVNNACALPRDSDPVKLGNRVLNVCTVQSAMPKRRVRLKLAQTWSWSQSHEFWFGLHLPRKHTFSNFQKGSNRLGRTYWAGPGNLHFNHSP